jgi:hypothetical protein
MGNHACGEKKKRSWREKGLEGIIEDGLFMTKKVIMKKVKIYV